MRPRTCLPLGILLGVCSVSLAAEPARDHFGDPLPEGAVARLGSLRLRHEQPITAGTFSPDSRMLVAVGQGGLILCWDTATGKEVRRWIANVPAGVNGLRFSADGKALILAGAGGAFRVVDAVTGAEQRRFDSPDRNDLVTLEVARDGKIAATVDYKGTVVVWDLPHSKRLREFEGPAKLAPWPGNVVALTPDGKQLVWPHADGSLHLIDATSGKEVLAFEMPPKRPGIVPKPSLAKVAVSPDGRYLAYGGLGTAATLCDVKTGKRVRELAPCMTGLTGLAFTVNSRFLAAANSADIRVFATLSGKEVRKLSRPAGAGNVLTFSPDGRMLAAFGPAAVIGAGHAIYLWDVDSGRSLHPPVGHESSAEALVFFPDGKRLASASAGDGFIVWDIAGERGLAHRRGWQNFYPNSFGMTGDGATLRFLDWNGVIHRWNWRAGRDEPPRPLAIPAVKQLVLSPDGRSVAALTSHRPPQLHLHEVKGDKAARNLRLPDKAEVSHLLFSPDSRRLAAHFSDGAWRLWDSDSGKLMASRQPDKGLWLSHASFAGDGRSLAVYDGEARVREIASGGERLRVSVPGGQNFSLGYSPDGRLLVCGQTDDTLLVFGTATGKQLARWQGKQGHILALAFSRDSRLLASSGFNGTIVVWKLPDGEGLPATLKAEEAVKFWQTLADSDAARANRALAGLVAAPAQAVPLIKERFPVAWRKLDAEQLARLVADLDSDNFPIRQKASRASIEAGPEVVELLHKTLSNKPSLEVKRRIEDILSERGWEQLRSIRALEVLERIGTPQAREVLLGLAGKPRSAELREEVQASLRRLQDRR